MEESKVNNPIETEGDMEILDMEPELHEFVRESDIGKNLKRKKRWPGDGLPDWLWPAVGGVVFLAVILCGILWLKVAAVTVILVAVLEEVLAYCLYHAPLWLHGAVIVMNVVLGMIFPVLVFMILANLIYVSGVWAFYQGERW